MAETAAATGDKIAEQVMDLFSSGVTLKDVHGYTDEEFDALYTLAYNLYNQGKYGDALNAFGFLLMHDQLERKYYKAFGSCQQMLRRYPEAIRNYSAAAMLDPMDPEPTFHTAECLVAMNMPDDARDALKFVVDITEGEPKYRTMRDRAKSMIEVLGGKA